MTVYPLLKGSEVCFADADVYSLMLMREKDGGEPMRLHVWLRGSRAEITLYDRATFLPLWTRLTT
jgi:hypothetical protein